MDILYQDNRIFVCLKPYGIVSTDEPGGMPSLIRSYLNDETACVRTVHRLDQVVGGVMVFARSKEAARRLGMQVQQRGFSKEYYAVSNGLPSEEKGTFSDLLWRDKQQRRTFIVPNEGKDVQPAVLHYKVLAHRNGMSLVRIALETGRTHQIRAQFSGHGFPLVGDKKYGADTVGTDGIALWSHAISFDHPQTGTRLSFTAPPSQTWPWSEFPEAFA